VLDDGWHAGSIWAVFLCSLASPFMFRWILAKKEAAAENDEEAEGETGGAGALVVTL
jgi:hypothetical protein